MSAATLVWIPRQSLSMRSPGGIVHHALSDSAWTMRCGLSMETCIGIRTDNAAALRTRPCPRCHPVQP